MMVLGWFTYIGMLTYDTKGFASSLDLGLLRLIIFKHALKKSKSSDVANQIVRDIFQIFKDLEQCSVIYHQSSFLKNLKGVDVTNIDEIELQAL